MLERHETINYYTMETTNKEIIEKKVYESGREHSEDYAERKARNGFGMGLAGVLTGGAALLSQWSNGRGLFGFGGGSMPENININTAEGSADSGSSSAPTAFQAWEKGCEEALALTNTIWQLKVNTQQQMYDHRETDISEKFSLYKSQIDGDFGLYKTTRDLYDVMNDKLVAASFENYKFSRDSYDAVMNRIGQLEKEVAVNSAIRPYQDKLLQGEIAQAYASSVNYTDRRCCKMIEGVVTLPSTPTVTGYPSYCCCSNNSGAASGGGSTK